MPRPLILLSRVAAPPAPSLGQVATRSAVPHNFGNTNNYMVETMHYNRSGAALTSIQVAWANWATSSETNNGGTHTVTTGVEYPIGSGFTQLLYSGVATGVDSSGGTILSDAGISLVAPIPDNALFGIRSFHHNTVGIPNKGNADNHNQALGDRTRTGGTDLTMGGTIVDNTSTTNIWPVAIIGLTTKRRLAFIGNSRTAAFGDTILDASGDTGQLARGLGDRYAYMNLAMSGETGALFLAHNSKRGALAQAYADTIIYMEGINDIRASVTAATLISNRSAVAALFTGKLFVPGTIFPDASSSNLWIDAAGQTVPGNDTQRVLYNDDVRALAVYLEIADLFEDARNNGKFKSDGTANKYTTDGLHGTTFAYQQCAGLILPP